jgi:hypothetical protein
MCINNQEPTKAAIIAGIPNFNKTSLLACFPTKKNLNKLFAKCTMPHNPIAISTGKKSIKTGVNRVPNPNPEKKVKMAVKNTVIDMIIISIELYLNY